MQFTTCDRWLNHTWLIEPVRSAAIFLIVLSCGIGFSLRAQTPDTSTVQGRVEDPNLRAVPGAAITIHNPLTGLTRKGTTDARGKFSFAGLPVLGNYALTAEKSGFAAAHLSGIALAGGRIADFSFQLNPAGTQTRVLVTGTVGEVRTGSPQLGDRLGARQMEETPLPNRRITFLPLLNAANRPALNQGDTFMNQDLFTTNGSGRRQTWFEVDGGNAIDAWGRQTIFTNIPLAAIAEMTVIENAFSAEYGFGLGGAVNIVTKSGSNEFHGEVLGLWRPSGPEAKLFGFTSVNASSGNDVTNDKLTQEAGSISGPVGNSGKTQFFLSGEFSQEDRASPVTSPIHPGNFIGHYRDYLGYLRLDHQLGSANTLFLRSNIDIFSDTNPNGAVGGSNLPSVDRVFRRRTYSEEFGETAVVRPTLVNNLRAQFQLASPITQFSPVVYGTQFVIPISAGGTFTSGTSQSALLLNRQYEWNDTVAASAGNHQITFGGEVLHAHNGGDSKEYGGPIFLGQFVYNPCTASPSVCESSTYLNDIANVQSYTQSYGNASYLVDDMLWALFAEDSFRVRPNLTLNYGLRYERQTFTDARSDFAPRIGFSYDIDGRGKTVIHGGFGIYYAQVVDDTQANYSLSGPQGFFNYTAAPGQAGFPASVQSAPLPAFPPGAVLPPRSIYIRPGRSSYLNQFFPVSELRGYPGKLLNPYSEQWTLGFEKQLYPGWILGADYVGSHTLRNVRPLDVDPPAPFLRTAQGQSRTAQAANCTRPYWMAWYRQHGMSCDPLAPTNPQPPYSVIQSDVNDGYGYYDALDVNLSHRFHERASMLASYTWSHAIDNVDPDVPNQNPDDPNFPGVRENGNAIFDQRHRFVVSGFVELPLQFNFGGVATLASGLPFNFITGSTNSGDFGATTDRPVIRGAVVGRNKGRGQPIYQVDPFIERAFALGLHSARVKLRAEAFNVLNHNNFVGYSGTYGNDSVPGLGFGKPLAGVTNQLPARSFQFSATAVF